MGLRFAKWWGGGADSRVCTTGVVRTLSSRLTHLSNSVQRPFGAQWGLRNNAHKLVMHLVCASLFTQGLHMHKSSSCTCLCLSTPADHPAQPSLASNALPQAFSTSPLFTLLPPSQQAPHTSCCMTYPSPPPLHPLPLTSTPRLPAWLQAPRRDGRCVRGAAARPARPFLQLSGGQPVLGCRPHLGLQR